MCLFFKGWSHYQNFGEYPLYIVNGVAMYESQHSVVKLGEFMWSTWTNYAEIHFLVFRSRKHIELTISAMKICKTMANVTAHLEQSIIFICHYFGAREGFRWAWFLSRFFYNTSPLMEFFFLTLSPVTALWSSKTLKDIL